MRSDLDPDLLLIESMLAPPPLDDARRSLDYWRSRGKALPLHRRAARREAREMATRWEERVRAAELARFEASLVGRLMTALGIPTHWVRWVRVGKRALLLLAWTLVPRRLKLFAAGLAAAGVLVALGSVTALVLVIAQLS
jgi:hypothetical protein